MKVLNYLQWSVSVGSGCFFVAGGDEVFLKFSVTARFELRIEFNVQY